MNLQNKVLEFFEQKKGDVFSGQDLADIFSVSRNAIWKAVNALKQQGHKIESMHKGYSMSTDSNVLTSQSIKKYLRNRELNVLEVMDIVNSTNDELKKRAIAGQSHGSILIANKQSSGKGRQGKSFVSPLGGVYISILLRPEFKAVDGIMLTALSGVAVAKTIEKHSSHKANIKWVNDVFVEGKKVCGILTEAEIDVENYMFKYLVIGIGINLVKPSSGYGEYEDIVGNVFDSENDFDKSKFVADVIDNVFDYYQSYNEKEFLAEYQQRQLLLGKVVEVFKLDKVEFKGKVKGVNHNCELVIEKENGEEIAISSGSVCAVRTFSDN